MWLVYEWTDYDCGGLFDANPMPDDEQIGEALGANYCRCGCYVRIQRAVRQAADEMAGQVADEVSA